MKISDVSLCKEEDIARICFRHALFKPEDISPLNVYYILKDLVGPPNGDFDETKSQWTYFLQVPDAKLEIYDWKLETWSIAVYVDVGDDVIDEFTHLMNGRKSHQDVQKRISELIKPEDIARAEKIGDEFLDLLRKLVPKFSSKISKVAAEAKRFVLQNPFALYYNSAEILLGKAKKNDDNSSDYCRSAFFLFIAAFEGLLNLVYELYAKPDLRDERIYDRLAREQIDIKVRLAPLYCSCFTNNPVDHHSEVFKRFHSIVNLRNDFIHANFTKPMKTPIVFEDGITFMVQQETRDKNGLPKSIEDLSPPDIQIVKDSIDQMTGLLIEAMQPRFRHEFRKILYEDYVPVLIDDGEVIVEVE